MDSFVDSVKLINIKNNNMRLFLVGLFALLMGSLSAQDVATVQKEAEKLMNAGDYAGATAKFKEAIALDTPDSENATLYTYAGMAAKESGDIAFAKEVLKKAITKGNDSYTFDMLEDICKADKDYDCQAYMYKVAMEKMPEQKASFAKKLAYTYYNGKNYKELVPVCHQVIALNGADSKMTQFIAVAYQKTNQSDSAMYYFKELLKTDDSNSNANIFMGQYYYQLAKTKADKAKANYESLQKKDRIAWSNFQKETEAIYQKYYPQAATYLEKAYATTKKNSIKSMLYNVYNKLGDTQKALNYK